MVSFTVCRREPELVAPARATPNEVKSLSDIDNLPQLRQYPTHIEFYRRRHGGGGPKHPASSIKAALAEALVHYYPMAGRLRALPGGKKMVVDCTAEGAVFVEADAADARLEEFGAPLVPPYPCVDQFMCDVGDFTAVLNKPLLYLQVTQLGCGGLVLALTMCHNVVDGFGMVQIMRCILDLARGEPLPAVLPVWDRHLMASSSAAAAASDSRAAVDADVSARPMALAKWTLPPLDDWVVRSFLFGPREIAVLRSGLPAPLGRSATVFELITAAVWRCRAAAQQHPPHERVSVMFTMNTRGSSKGDQPLLPGFYGNAFFVMGTEATAGELCGGPLARAVQLVRDAKRRLTNEYVRSVLGLMGRGEYGGMQAPLDTNLFISDVTRFGDGAHDLGAWAERVGGGAPMAGHFIARMGSFLMSGKDANGDKCVVVPVCLPEQAMGRFASQISLVTTKQAVHARSSL